MPIVMDFTRPLVPHSHAADYLTAVHLRIWFLCGTNFMHAARVVDYFEHRKVDLLIVNEEDVQTAVKATKAWRHEQKGAFDFSAVPHGDGSVTVYLEWGDGMDGDILTYDSDADARKHLAVMIKNATEI